VAVPGSTGGRDGTFERVRIDIAHIDQLASVRVFLDGGEMIFRYSAASDECKSDFSIDNRFEGCRLVHSQFQFAGYRRGDFMNSTRRFARGLIDEFDFLPQSLDLIGKFRMLLELVIQEAPGYADFLVDSGRCQFVEICTLVSAVAKIVDFQPTPGYQSLQAIVGLAEADPDKLGYIPL
jgi:hypothetical protein